MTVVPLSFQLCGWIPAWWSGEAGGDDLLELLGPDLLAAVRPLRAVTTGVSAYSPELGVSELPGPKAVTEEAVAAGEAVILHGLPGQTSSVLIPAVGLLTGGPTRPLNHDLKQAESDFAQAVVSAEHALREAGTSFSATPRRTTVRPLPPGADPRRKALLVRAVRMWSAVDALPARFRSPALTDVLRASARATLACYQQDVVTAADRARRFA